MMYGLNRSFNYFECSKCGCLQIKEVPQDMVRYYSRENYYSFDKSDFNFFVKMIYNARNEYCLFRNNFLGKIINRYYPYELLLTLGDLKIDTNSKILDVGCGYGEFLYNLNRLNFKQLVGIDPYLKNETHSKNLNILKKDIHQLPDDQKFDVILYSHSFEHMEDQRETLKKTYGLLSHNGYCIISMPVKNEHIWNLYGLNWVQIDAPRHFFIHTRKSFQFLVDEIGFQIKSIVFDSTDLQFWGSEQYKQGIPLNSENSYLINPKKSVFTSDDINYFKSKAAELNKKELGDQAIFVLNKV